MNHAAVLAGGGWRWQLPLWTQSRYLHPIMWNYYYSSFALVLITYKKNLGNGHISNLLPPSPRTETSVFKHTLIYRLFCLVLDISVKKESRLIASES